MNFKFWLKFIGLIFWPDDVYASCPDCGKVFEGFSWTVIIKMFRHVWEHAKEEA